ncbi:TetR/AcrR family transcriptional regulator [Streptomyces albipurpureus]|uniref:TetR family transcriptional regulator n=1 Tax=Streptomyces albipurpureus TaxID=2897419 RepID=A0ABT0UGQ5_9ACTN|nr:TetR family transcriptional regulator [Streptomyces sp. CWNU-1]MCM2387802.1 TetR family transcriptional regulator [Streptomyces sp. CWNU-1]
MSDSSAQPAGQRAGTGKGALKRTALLDAAEEILLADGYAELSMRAVAAAAGVRLGHLQYYFPTRADLVGAVLGRVLNRSLDRLQPLLAAESAARATDPAQVVRTILAEQEDPRLVRLFTDLWALAAHDETVAEAVRGFYRDYQDQVGAFLHQCRPDLTEQVCRSRAAVFTMLMEGAALFRSGIAAHRTTTTDAELLTLAATLFSAPPS